MTLEKPSRRKIGSRERALLILLGIVALLALVFVFLINAGDGDDIADAPTPAPGPTVTESPDEPAPTTPPVTDDLFEGRDPFQPLVVVGPGDGTPGPDDGNGGPTPTPTSTARPGDDGDSRRVVLLDIFTSDGERRATVQVDGQEFTVVEGETFADNFRLLDLAQDCGTFVFGDERFTLCIGQEVQK
ncbi:MAG TPA: hypothetical protein VGB52_08380 [Actinomycetota bacterium]